MLHNPKKSGANIVGHPVDISTYKYLVTIDCIVSFLRSNILCQAPPRSLPPCHWWSSPKDGTKVKLKQKQIILFQTLALTFLLNKKYAATSKIQRAIIQIVTPTLRLWEFWNEISSSTFVPILLSKIECLCWIFQSMWIITNTYKTYFVWSVSIC